MAESRTWDTHPGKQEEEKLDEAIRRADDLLIASLQGDEGRRRWRSRKRLILAAGGLTMAICVTVALVCFLGATPDEKNKSAELTQRGWKLWQQQKLDEAEAAFAEAARLDPDRADAWNGLGWARFNAGKRGEAVEAFKKCVELEPTHPAALNGLGQAAFMNREYDKAEQYFLRSPTASAPWYGLARLYLLQGKFADAEKYANWSPMEPRSCPCGREGPAHRSLSGQSRFPHRPSVNSPC
jgi:tetratricopeptide (TPR) repeat protein